MVSWHCEIVPCKHPQAYRALFLEKKKRALPLPREREPRKKRTKRKSKEKENTPTLTQKKKGVCVRAKGGCNMPAKGQAKLTLEQIQEGVEKYFSDCDASRVEYVTKAGIPQVRQIPYTMIGLANALGVTRDTLYRWCNGDYPVDDKDKGKDADKGKHIQQQVSDTLTRARLRVEQYTVEHAAMGDIDNRIAQLLMSGWGYASKQEVEHSGNIAVQWQGTTPEDAADWAK